MKDWRAPDPDSAPGPAPDSEAATADAPVLTLYFGSPVAPASAADPTPDRDTVQRHEGRVGQRQVVLRGARLQQQAQGHRCAAPRQSRGPRASGPRLPSGSGCAAWPSSAPAGQGSRRERAVSARPSTGGSGCRLSRVGSRTRTGPAPSTRAPVVSSNGTTDSSFPRGTRRFRPERTEGE